MSDLNLLEIEVSLTELEEIDVKQFKRILEKSIKIKSFEYLMERRGRKGIEVHYSSLKMAEYLLPNDELSITEKRYIFSMRNRMINIENNFRGKMEKKTCICGEYEDMNHIYSCKIKNSQIEKVPYKMIFGNDIKQMKIISERFRKIFEEKDLEKRNILPRILKVDPLYSIYTGMEIN